jgi:hypothetical protein
MMKKSYLLALLTLFAFGLQAQTSTAAQGSCKNSTEGTVTINWNALLNCPGIAGLEGVSSAGFHSTPDGWTTSVDFDDPSAVSATNSGTDTFTVTVNTSDYYGVALDLITEITFVFNNPGSSSGDPWTETGRDTVPGTFGCEDLKVDIASLAECGSGSVGIQDLNVISFMDVMPNPAQGEAVINFGNPMGLEFNFMLLDATGRLVRSEIVAGSQVRIDRADLPAGLYFASLSTEDGTRATATVIFK